MKLHDILAGKSRPLSIEALYLALREVKQSANPPESRKEHVRDADGSCPSQEAIALAAALVQQITTEAGCSLGHLTRAVRNEYVDDLLALARSINDATTSIDKSRGRRLLEELRMDN